jgi:hypothetical protein
MAVSEAKRKANKRWNASNMKQINLPLVNAEYEALNMYCEAKQIPKNTFIRLAIREKMEREPITQDQKE